VKTTLELIQEAIPKSERDPITDQSLDIANRSTERVLTLINSLLDISQLESGNVDVQTELADIQLTITETIDELIPQANEIGIVLRKGKQNDMPKVFFNKELIQRVLTNLLDNALKFTPEGGVITVDAQDDKDGYVTVRVSDTGPGIPEDYREDVFRRFSQVPGLRGRRRGSGLGLTFCRLAIEAHGGQIWIDSSANNTGATLAFTLPTAKTSNR
jgi:signal transduction histidine kinase